MNKWDDKIDNVRFEFQILFQSHSIYIAHEAGAISFNPEAFLISNFQDIKVSMGKLIRKYIKVEKQKKNPQKKPF